jgi:1-acyl-sn-glycerol-3-phosphate acyltransferase
LEILQQEAQRYFILTKINVIKAQKNKVIGKFFKIYHNRLLKKHFYRIHLAGYELLKKIDTKLPTILYMNHSNWWDGFMAFQLTSKYLGADDYLMMDIEQMKKYRFFKYVGVFSVNRTDAREGIESINYAAELLKNTKKYLWIFPQGVMQVQDFEPVKFYNGITRIAEKIENVNLVPVSARYEFIMEQRPEVFLKIGEPDVINNSKDISKNFTEYLQNKLVNELAVLKQDVINKNFGDYKIIFTGNTSRNKAVDKLYE